MVAHGGCPVVCPVVCRGTEVPGSFGAKPAFAGSFSPRRRASPIRARGFSHRARGRSTTVQPPCGPSPAQGAKHAALCLNAALFCLNAALFCLNAALFCLNAAPLCLNDATLCLNAAPFCLNAAPLCLNDATLCLNAAPLCLNAALFCLNAALCCLNAALLCLNAALLCLNAALFCLNAALFCLNAAPLCLNAAPLCLKHAPLKTRNGPTTNGAERTPFRPVRSYVAAAVGPNSTVPRPHRRRSETCQVRATGSRTHAGAPVRAPDRSGGSCSPAPHGVHAPTVVSQLVEKIVMVFHTRCGI